MRSNAEPPLAALGTSNDKLPPSAPGPPARARSVDDEAVAREADRSAVAGQQPWRRTARDIDLRLGSRDVDQPARVQQKAAAGAQVHRAAAQHAARAQASASPYTRSAYRARAIGRRPRGGRRHSRRHQCCPARRPRRCPDRDRTGPLQGPPPATPRRMSPPVATASLAPFPMSTSPPVSVSDAGAWAMRSSGQHFEVAEIGKALARSLAEKRTGQPHR